MKNLIKYFFLLLLSSFSCKEDCEEPLSVFDKSIQFIVIDDTSRLNLIRDNNLNNPDYFYVDSVKFLDGDFNELPSYRFSTNQYKSNAYTIFLKILESRNSKFDPYKPDNKTYYLYLNQNDLDTIRVEYYYDPKDCGYTVIKEDVYINGQFQNPEDPEFGRIYVIEK